MDDQGHHAHSKRADNLGILDAVEPPTR